jgi:signal transduction histidine kinase/CheY-like chemotaxis protein
MKLSTRLVASFSVVGAVTVLLGGFSLNRLWTVRLAAREVEQVQLPSSRLISAMDAEVARIRMAELQYVLSATPGQRRWYGHDTDNLLVSLAHDRASFEPLIDGPVERDLYWSFMGNWYLYLNQHRAVLALADSGRTAEAMTTLRGPSQITFDRASGNLQELRDLTVRAGIDATQRSEVQYASSRSFIIACSAAALLAGLILALLLMRAITRPLRSLTDAAERIEGGDLSHRVKLRAHDEFTMLATTFNRMARTLGSVQRSLEHRVADLDVAKEAHREARQLAEMANQAKSEFLANMSHELRTPLNSVIGFAAILLKNRLRGASAKELGYLERIEANGRHLLALINSVLDLSKVEAGHMQLEITSVSLGDLARETVAELEPQALARSVRLSVESPDGTHLLDTDRARLKQVLVNLVGNAVKFSPDRAVRVVVRTDPDSGRPLRVDVVDSGIGIPADRMESIFEAFQQADNSTSRQHGGTGLGLTISRSLAVLMGFHVEATSEVGVGSTFSIVFSVGTVGAAAVAPTAMQLMQTPSSPLLAIDDTRLLVLVIDDSSDGRVILKRAFEDLGCAVVLASGVDEGFALARKMRPGMITIDLMMPRKNGWDALRELRSDPLLCDIPIVVVSAVASENRDDLFGAQDYLDKPVSREDLLRVIGGDKLGARAAALAIA